MRYHKDTKFRKYQEESIFVMKAKPRHISGYFYTLKKRGEKVYRKCIVEEKKIQQKLYYNKNKDASQKYMFHDKTKKQQKIARNKHSLQKDMINDCNKLGYITDKHSDMVKYKTNDKMRIDQHNIIENKSQLQFFNLDNEKKSYTPKQYLKYKKTLDKSSMREKLLAQKLQQINEKSKKQKSARKGEFDEICRVFRIHRVI